MIDDLLVNAFSYYYDKGVYNNDDFAKYFLIDGLYDKVYFNYFVNSQNPDGGFGLAEGCASNIIDTNLALKALADLDETEAMTNAAVYIASLQNVDGCFSYQMGLVL